MSFSQTAQETIDYLKTFYSNVKTNGSFEVNIDYNNVSIYEGKAKGFIFINQCVSYNSTEGCTSYETEHINCKDISGINLKFQPYKLISDVGKTKVEENECWLLKIHYSNKDFTFCLNSEDDKYASRLKNSLTKLAKYSGAKILSEELFD